MLYPSIDSLLTKVDSKYKLATVAAKRAREMQINENQLIERPRSHKFVGKALEEIQEGLLYYMTPADSGPTMDKDQYK